jgi:hypothetical protein
MARTPLAGAKIIPIAPVRGRRNHPFCRHLYPRVLRPYFLCCVSQNSCLFNYPRHAIAPSGHEQRGARVGTVSFSETVSHDVRMLRRTIGPALTGWLENPAIVEITPNPKGDRSNDAQHPNRCDDLSHHRWTDYRRMFSNRHGSDGRCQQALHRTRFQLLFEWEEAERAAPETETPPSSSPRPSASRCSKSPEPSVGSVRIAPGARNHDRSRSSCTDRCSREADRSYLCTCRTAALALPGRAERWFFSESVAICNTLPDGYRPCTCFYAAKRAFGTLALPGGVTRASIALGLQGEAGGRRRRALTSIDVEDAYVARVMAAFKKVTPNTKGNQFGRTKRAARKQAIIRLIKRGYSVKAATQIIDDAHDIFLVEAAAMRGAS